MKQLQVCSYHHVRNEGQENMAILSQGVNCVSSLILLPYSNDRLSKSQELPLIHQWKCMEVESLFKIINSEQPNVQLYIL